MAAVGATRRSISTNGIEMQIAELGSGPVVILLHGFPETWYTWRHQMEALAAAGFHAVAPDLRGFGLTESPVTETGERKLTPLDTVGDIVGLIYAFGGETVFLVAHDSGAFIGWNLCLMRPDLVRAYVPIGVPLIRPGPSTKPLIPLSEGFYVNRFGKPGRAEADFGRFDTTTVLRKIYTLFSRSELQIASEGEEILDLVKESEAAPSWLTDDVLQVKSELYEHSGFEGPLWFTYRNRTRNFELMAPWINCPVKTPCLYIMGEDDYVRKFPLFEDNLTIEAMRSNVPNLKEVVFLPGGHFVEEDSPNEVSELIIKFFREIST